VTTASAIYPGACNRVQDATAIVASAAIVALWIL